MISHTAYGDSIIATIPISGDHYGVAVNPNTNRIYVVGDSGVLVINGATNNIIDTINATFTSSDSRGMIIDVDPNTNMIYAGNWIIDGSTDKIVGQISAGTSWLLTDLRINSDTNKIYSLRSTTYCFHCPVGWIDIANGTTGSLNKSMNYGGWLDGMAINSVTNKIYFGGYNDGYIYEIDGNTDSVIAQLPDDYGTVSLAVDPITNQLYGGGVGVVYVFDLATNNLLTKIPMTSSDSTSSWVVAVNPATNKIYASNAFGLNNGNTLAVIDGSTNKIIQNLTVGTDPAGIAANPNTNKIYVVNEGSNTLSVIDGNSSDTWASATTITPNPSMQALLSTRIYHIIVTDNSGSPTAPTGTVSWSDGNAGGHLSRSSCTLVSASSNSSTCSITYTAPSTTGPVTLAATYSGDGTHSTSSGTSSLTITMRSTSTVVTPNPSSAIHGSTIKFNATVTDASSGTKSAPTGMILWSASMPGGSFSSDTCTLSSTSSSKIYCTVTYTAPLTTGSVTIAAKYSGDAIHNPSRGVSALTVT